MSSRALFIALNTQLPVPPGMQELSGGQYWMDPTIWPPPEREAFDAINYIPLPAIGATAIIVSVLLEPGYNLIIRAYANNFVGGGWTEGSGSVTWQINVDNAAVDGYDAIPASLGSPANPVYHPSGIPIQASQTVHLTITNNHLVLAGQLSGGRLMGYRYSKEYADPTRGANP